MNSFSVMPLMNRSERFSITSREARRTLDLPVPSGSVAEDIDRLAKLIRSRQRPTHRSFEREAHGSDAHVTSGAGRIDAVLRHRLANRSAVGRSRSCPRAQARSPAAAAAVTKAGCRGCAFPRRTRDVLVA